MWVVTLYLLSQTSRLTLDERLPEKEKTTPRKRGHPKEDAVVWGCQIPVVLTNDYTSSHCEFIQCTTKPILISRVQQ